MDISADAEGLRGKEKDYRTIRELGADIISSEEFQRIVGQRHHIFSTVGYHSVHVAQKMLLFARFFDMNERDIVRASLWHDVGIYDRKSFAHGDTAWEHPVRSLHTAESKGKLTDTEADMIANHMWPVTPERPRTREGFFITLADKWCAITEFLNFHDDRIDEIIHEVD